MADQEFKKDPRLFDYEEASPENRNRGFKSARNNSNWDAIDKALLAGYEGANAADWGQTQQVSRNPEHYREMPFPMGSSGLIGTHPSRDKVSLLMGSQAIAVPAIANQLSGGWRKALLGALFAAKALAVHDNTKDMGPGSPGIAAVRF